MKAILYFDGASRGNPGPSGAGWSIKNPEGEFISNGNEYLGEKSNNFAEYSALIMGMKAASENEIKELLVVGDSNLVISQVTGKFKVKTTSLRPLLQQVKEEEIKFKKIDYYWIPREENEDADLQSRLAIDNHFEKSGGVLGSILGKYNFKK